MIYIYILIYIYMCNVYLKFISHFLYSHCCGIYCFTSPGSVFVLGNFDIDVLEDLSNLELFRSTEATVEPALSNTCESC